jgi:phosphatidylserine decarboxylase
MVYIVSTILLMRYHFVLYIANWQPRWFKLTSSRKRAKITGEVLVKFGLADPASPSATGEELQSAWDKLLCSFGERTGLQQMLDAPATESVGVGIIHAELDDSDTLAHLIASPDEEGSDSSDLETTTVEATTEKKTKRKRLVPLRPKVRKPFQFTQDPHDVLGMVFMEIESVKDLPPERNSISRDGQLNLLVTRTGYDMDPFVIVSFGKKTFRTRVIRHNLNPVFKERVVFQVMKSEKNYQIIFNIYDRDTITSNDFVAEYTLPLSAFIEAGPVPDPESGLYHLPEPWNDPDAGRDKAKRVDSKIPGLLRGASMGLTQKKGNGKNGGNSGSTTPTRTGSPLELTRTVSLPADLGDVASTVLISVDLIHSLQRMYGR